MARPSNTAARRAQIVEGLLQVIGRTGYEGASTQEIAAAAGLTAGLVHYHFGDKRQILLELVGVLEARVAERVEQRLIAAGSSPLARLAGFLDAHLALGAGDDPVAVQAWVAVGAEAVRQPEVRARFEEAIGRSRDHLEALVRTALEAQGRALAAAPTIAAALLAAIHGYFLLSTAAPAVTPRGTAAESVRRMAEGLLATAAADNGGPRSGRGSHGGVRR